MHQGKLAGIFTKGRYLPPSSFSFYETKECIPHKAQAVVFSRFVCFGSKTYSCKRQPFLASFH